MKFRVQYKVQRIIVEEFEAQTEEEAYILSRERSKAIINEHAPDASCGYEVMHAGRFSLRGEALFLDDVPVTDGQVLLVKNGKGQAIPGRVRHRQGKGWDVTHQEFIGHTYLDTPLTESWLKDLIATPVEENHHE